MARTVLVTGATRGVEGLALDLAAPDAEIGRAHV